MGKMFFQSWKLWEKLCFFLACAIVLVVLAGALKLLYTHWRLRKYTVVAEKERKEQTLQRQMSQRRRHDEIPFGIRALESGIETEGVWVSRPNTPEQHSRGSSVGSLSLKQYRPGSEGADVEKQMLPGAVRRAGSVSLALSSNPPDLGFDGRRPADQSRYRTSRDSSPDAAITKPPRARHPPLSYAKYSNTPYAHRYSSTQTSLESLQAAQQASMEAIRRASTSIHLDSRSNSEDSSHSGNDAEPISAAAPRLLSQAVPRPRQQSVDFELMQTHRLSQAAEMGQLTPRVRRPGQSRDSSVASIPASIEHVDYFARRSRVAGQLSSGGSSPTNPFSTPKIDALPAAVRRSSMPDVTPFAQFCQTAPQASRPVSQGTVSSSRRSTEAPEVYTPIFSSVVGLQYGLASTPTPASLPAGNGKQKQSQSEPKRSPFEKRPSAVVRGHGTGFEILKPGSFPQPRPDEEETPLQRQRAAAPPISLHNAYRPRSSSAGSGPAGRRLQKKRRPSVDSVSMTSLESRRKSRVSVL
ncbi:hypothetical protein LTR53_008896 [Teratosphaeriaceae sp. CCFEE 6253]|nr:hypothetical protein LTR53_008896 [Teratosphaeriaceae sp. CCFEE 6253]